jgi:Transglycosylase SLT domain
LSRKRKPNRKASTLTRALAGSAIAVTAIASGAAASSATVGGATGQATSIGPSRVTSASSPPQGKVVLDAFTKPRTADTPDSAATTTAANYSFGALEHIWMAVGGSGGTASHAACIAQHESAGNPNAISPTDDWGLWQIHDGGPAMLNPAANAATAVRMSGNGTNWSAWTTAPMC